MNDHQPSSTQSQPSDDGAKDLEQLAQKNQTGIFREFLVFLREHRAWWLIPILLSLCAIGALLVLGSTGAAPFIYSLF